MSNLPKQPFDVSTLREFFRYEPETGLIFWAKKPARGSVKAGDVAGKLASNGYVRIQLQGISLQAHRVALALTCGSWPQDEVDHINRNKADNRIVNLRHATHAENMRNTKPRSHSKTGVKGVSVWKKKYRARITANGHRIDLGLFETAEAASAAYVDASKRFHLEFATC